MNILCDGNVRAMSQRHQEIHRNHINIKEFLTFTIRAYNTGNLMPTDAEVMNRPCDERLSKTIDSRRK